MISCRELTEKVAKGERPKTWLAAVECKIHLFMCKHCANFKKQIEMINETAKLYFKDFQKEKKEKIENLKEKVKRNL